MNVKKTKKFKENRPENCHVHDSSFGSGEEASRDVSMVEEEMGNGSGRSAAEEEMGDGSCRVRCSTVEGEMRDTSCCTRHGVARSQVRCPMALVAVETERRCSSKRSLTK